VYPGGSDSALDETATGEDGSYALSFTAQEDEAPKVLRLTFDAERGPVEEATVDFTTFVTSNGKFTPRETLSGDDLTPAEATVSEPPSP
jgi:hypothetical protein